MAQRIPRSIIWRHFDQRNGQTKFATCNICRNQVSYKTTISNLKKHMTRNHPQVQFSSRVAKATAADFVEELVKAEEDVRLISSPGIMNMVTSETSRAAVPTSQTPIQSASTHAAFPTSETSQSDNTGHATPQNRSLKIKAAQSKISKCTHKKLAGKEKNEIHAALVAMIIEDFQPFSIVEDSGFKKFVKALNPIYNLPRRKNISANIIPAKHSEAKTRLKNLIGLVETCCITTDCWTSCTNDSYIAVTVHFIYMGKFHSYLLTCQALEGSHTTVNLTRTLRDILDEWKITNKVIFAVSDNAANIIGALKDLHIKFMGCAAHKLNLIVEKALSLEMVKAVLFKVKKIATHFHCSPLAWQTLQECQKKEGITDPKELLNSVPTGWISTYILLQRFILLEAPLKTALADITADLPELTATEWQMARDLTAILEPFEAMATFLSRQKYPPASSLIVVIRGFIETLEGFIGNKTYASVKPAVEVLLQGVLDKDGFGNLECSKSLIVATLLDPRYKSDGFSHSDYSNMAKDEVKQMMTEVAAIAPNCSSTPSIGLEDISDLPMPLFNVFLRKKSISTVAIKTPESRAVLEMRRYLEEETISLSADPISWWYENRREFPLMSKVALERLCVVCTSVPCEQLFSKAGQILSDRRSRLTPYEAQMLVFLNANKNVTPTTWKSKGAVRCR